MAEQPLTALEASFLALERPGLPMNVAGVVLFDASTQKRGRLTLKGVRRLVASRLPQLPKLRQRVACGWMGFVRPHWADMSDFDMDAHLHHHRLGVNARMSDFSALCGQILEQLLSRERPLWEVHLVDGLPDRRQALIVKAHHAMADGIAAMKVAEVLFGGPLSRSETAKGMPPPLHFSLEAQPTALGLGQAALGVVLRATRSALAPTGPFNGPVGVHRAYATATVPMDVIRQLKLQLGGTVDDVVLAIVAAGLGHHLALERYPDPPTALRAMIPVSTWRFADNARLGNHVTAVFIDLPLDTHDPARLVQRISRSKAVLRSAHAAAGMSVLIETAGRLPHPLHGAAVSIAAALPTAHLVLSDIPGPDAPMHILGRRIVATYPMIPLPPTVGLSIAAVSVGGQICIGIVADPGLVPEPQHLAEQLEAAGRAFARSLPGRRPRGRTPGVERHAA